MKCANHPDGDAVTRCLTCGSHICETCRVVAKNESYCKRCVSMKMEGLTKHQHSPVLAAILSFIIGGAGQIYNGQPIKGVLILLTSWLVIPWIYGIYDAYATAKKISAGTIIPKSSSGCVVVLIVCAVLAFFFTVIFGILAAIAIPNFVKAKQVAMKSACISSLKLIEEAKQAWYISTSPNKDAVPTWDNMVPTFLTAKPICPSGGVYSLGSITTPVTCSIGTSNTPSPDDDHVIDREPAGYAAYQMQEVKKKDILTVPARVIRQKVKKGLPRKGVKSEKSVKVYLKNGQFFNAAIEKEDANHIVLKIDGGTFTINKADIETIEYQ